MRPFNINSLKGIIKQRKFFVKMLYFERLYIDLLSFDQNYVAFGQNLEEDFNTYVVKTLYVFFIVSVLAC